MGSRQFSQVKILLGGGIGVGKTTVGSMFVERGFTLIEADAIGHTVLLPGTEATQQVAELWPDCVTDGVVDRQALAGVVFADPAALAELEAVTHPAISRGITRQVAACDSHVVVEIPLMRIHPEGEWVRVALVADPEVRLARAVARGGDSDDVRRRMSQQPSDKMWIEWADMSVDTSDSFFATRARVLDLIDELTA